MGLPNIGPLELIIILAVLLLIVGPRRLPEMGQAVGRTIREFRKASTEITEATAVSADSKPAATNGVTPPAPGQPATPVQPTAPLPSPAPAPSLVTGVVDAPENAEVGAHATAAADDPARQA